MFSNKRRFVSFFWINITLPYRTSAPQVGQVKVSTISPHILHNLIDFRFLGGFKAVVDVFTSTILDSTIFTGAGPLPPLQWFNPPGLTSMSFPKNPPTRTYVFGSMLESILASISFNWWWPFSFYFLLRYFYLFFLISLVNNSIILRINKGSKLFVGFVSLEQISHFCLFCHFSCRKINMKKIKSWI